MPSVNDIGVPGQPMDNPPLTPWQAAVRDALNGSDIPVNSRFPTTLDGLSDVSTAGVADNQALLFDSASGQWMPETLPAPPNEVSVGTASPTDAAVELWMDSATQILYYRDPADSTFKPLPVGGGTGGGPIALNDLTDVDTQAAVNGDVLAFNTGSLLWQPRTDYTTGLFTPVAPWVGTGSEGICTRQGGLVTIELRLVPNVDTELNTAWEAVGTLPVGFRPTAQRQAVVMLHDGDAYVPPGYLDYGPSGSCGLRSITVPTLRANAGYCFAVFTFRGA